MRILFTVVLVVLSAGLELPDQAEFVRNQDELRSKLDEILRLPRLPSTSFPLPLNPKVLTSREMGKYVMKDVELSSTPGRRIRIRITLPLDDQPAPRPAVICIPGHNDNLYHTYIRLPYRAFARVLAESGYVTAAVDVGQHTVFEKGNTLVGERLWDLIRTVDFLQSLAEVDRSRIGCAGLSLGGEMSMWLGAMDERIAAVVVSGFLAPMKHLETQGHCGCWKVPGLQETTDFPQIFSLIAPRPLLIQIGARESMSGFPVRVARNAFTEISNSYSLLNRPENAVLLVHPEGHVIDLPSLLEFFDRNLGNANSKPLVQQKGHPEFNANSPED